MTATMEAPLRSIRDMEKENPNAYDFSDIKDIVAGRSPQAEEVAYPLRAMLGGFEYFGRDYVTGTEFYGRKPKLNGLDRLVDLISSPLGEGEQDAVVTSKLVFARMANVCAMLLYVQVSDRQWRPATAEEVGNAFDLHELNEVRDRFSGLTATETDEGNATSAPTTA